MTNQPIPNGTKCRSKRRGDLLDQALIDPVVTLVRPQARLSSMCEVRAKDGYLAWVGWSDLYVLIEA